LSIYNPKDHELKKWRSLRDEFNSKFSSSKKTEKELSEHYNNDLNSNLKRENSLRKKKSYPKNFFKKTKRNFERLLKS
jgi:hypothetical protein